MSAYLVGGIAGLVSLVPVDWQAVGQAAAGLALAPVAAVLLAILRPWAATPVD